MSQEKAEKRFIIQQYIDKKDAEFCKENNILLWRIRYNENKEKRILELKKNHSIKKYYFPPKKIKPI